MNIQKGFAHIFLLIGVILVLLIGVIYLIFQNGGNDLRQSLSTLVNKQEVVSVTPTPASLEGELDTIPDSDPSEDFVEIDADIQNL